MFKKFVAVTGALDLLLGVFIAAQAIQKADPAAFLYPVMIGSFLLFCGACLIWAARDISVRGPVIFWQGLVRLAAVTAILLGYRYELVGQENLPAAIMDGIIGPTYLIGVTRMLGISPLKILLGRTK